MRAFVKIIGIAVGLTGLLGGALMSMGHLKTAEGDFRELELARLKNLAASWETQLLSVRSAFRDLVLRHSVTSAVDHPAEWAGWRVENKFVQMMAEWPTGVAKPRAWVLLRNNGETHAVSGDSTGLSLALEKFAQNDAPDIMLVDRHGPARSLALQYAPPADLQNPTPGRLVALVNPNELFKIPNDPPADWVLMNGPTEAFLASNRQPKPPIGAGTWSILLSQSAGMVNMDAGTPLAFCRIHVPGMQPLLLVSEINSPSNAGSTIGALVLLTSGTAFLVFALRPRRKAEPAKSSAPLDSSDPDELKATRETVTFRQIFQAVRTPMCVADETGRIIRVNAAARELLHLSKNGQPNDNITLIGTDFRGTMKEFLVRAAESEADSVSGCWLICENDKHYFDGEIVGTRLSASAAGKGPIVLEFIENRNVAAADRTKFSQIVTSVDAFNPQPVMLLDDQGRVIECNQAALEINSKLANSPWLHEVLPTLELSNVAAIVDPVRTERFESLFGARMYEFYPVPSASGMLLYGVKKSDAQSLQIALHQAQENFNSLCGLCSEAVLLVDPRTHQIQEANLAASDLFGAVHPGLIGKQMDEFADWPWNEDNLRAAVQVTRADGQCISCSFEQDLIKVEGEPTLLVVVAQLPEAPLATAHGLADFAQSVAEQINGSLQQKPETQHPPQIPVGPGMLVVTNPTVRDVARKMLERLGHSCEVFTNLDDATVYLVRSDMRPEFVMIDMGDFDQPSEWIEMLRARCGSVPCVGLADSNADDLPDGPNALLSKPFELEDIANSLHSLELEIAVNEN